MLLAPSSRPHGNNDVQFPIIIGIVNGIKTVGEIRKALQEFIATIMVDDRLRDDGAKRRHACRQPLRHPSTMQRKNRAARSFLAIRIAIQVVTDRIRPAS